MQDDENFSLDPPDAIPFHDTDDAEEPGIDSRAFKSPSAAAEPSSLTPVDGDHPEEGAGGDHAGSESPLQHDDAGSVPSWEEGGEIGFSAANGKTVERKQKKIRSPWGEQVQVYKVIPCAEQRACVVALSLARN